MQLIKTVDSENILRLEEDSGAAISIDRSSDTAHILSIIVPKSDRREGIGTALLFAAEQILFSQGIKKIDVDFADSIDGMESFFEQAGYTVKEGCAIYSVGMKKIMSSLSVRRVLANIIENATFVPMSDLMVDQLDALLELLSGFRINLSNSDMARFYKEASGVVYDDAGTPLAFILCSETENGLLVDLLAAVDGSNPRYVVSAMKGMLNAIIENGNIKIYDDLSMIVVNGKIDELMKRILKKGDTPDHIGNTMYASKTIVYDDDVDDEIEDDADEDLEDEWRREIKKVNFQANISWKMPWQRLILTDDGSANANAAMVSSRKKKQAAFSSAGISFEKYEDETEGLIMDDTVRIINENISSFGDVLPADVLKNMARPFYRGLAVMNGRDVLASIAWEYENVEDDEDTQARIEWYSASDSDSAKTLLEEYINEIKTEEVKRSYFEFDDLSDDDCSILREEGFTISNQESIDIIVPLSEIKKETYAEKKPQDYIRSLDSLNEKQFKRGIANSLFHNRKGLLEDAAFLNLEWFEGKVSCCVVSDNKVVGLLLVHRDGFDRLVIDLMFSAGAEYQADLLNMLRYSTHSAFDNYSDETGVILRRHSDDVRILTSKLLPDLKGRMVFFGERRDS